MESKVSRMRTIKQVVSYFKENDKDTVVNEYLLRRLVKEGRIPVVKTGKKALINLDMLLEYFNMQEPSKKEEVNDDIPVKQRIRKVQV